MKKRKPILFCNIIALLIITSSLIAQNPDNGLPSKFIEDTTYARKQLDMAKSFASIAKFDSAIIYYKKACDIYEQHKIPQYFSKCLNYISEQNIRVGNLPDATHFAWKALNQSLQDSVIHEIGKSYNNLGTISTYKGYMDSAIFYYEKALYYWLQEETDDKTPIIVVYTNMAVYLRIIGDYEKSLEYSKNAIEVINTCSKNMDEFLSHNYNTIGSIYHSKGKYKEALPYYNKALKLWLVTYNDKHPLVASIYNNLGDMARQNGDFKQALIYFQKAISIFHEIAGNINLNAADCHANLGMIYLSMENFSNALNEMNKALSIYKIINPEHPNLAIAYNNFSNIYSNYQDYDSALYYLNKSKEILIKTAPNNNLSIAICDLTIGANYIYTKEYIKALDQSRLAVDGFLKSLDEKSPYLAKAYNQIGKVYFNTEDYDLALHFYQKAIIVNSENFNDTNIYSNPELENIYSKVILLSTLTDKAQTLFMKYIQHSDSLHYLTHAFNTSEKAIQLLDILRNEQKTEDSKVFLNKKNFDIYTMAINYSLELFNITGEEIYFHKIFEFAEKSRYAVLQTSLMNMEAQQIAGIPDTLQQLERDLKLDIRFYTKLIDDEKEKVQQDPNKINIWQNLIFQFNKTHDSLISTFENDFPEYYDLKYNNYVTDINTIQANLSDNEVLIEYVLSDSTLFYFVISKSKTELIAEKINKDFYLKIDSLRNFLIYKDAPQNTCYRYHQIAYDLYAKLLLPVEEIIQGKDLIILPVGKLGTVPFESLAISPPEKNNSFKSLPYLIKKHAISYGYSATILVNSLLEDGGKANKKLIAFAPSFANDNEELIAELSERGNEYVSLKGAKEEVNTIVQLMSGQLFIDTMATEKNFKDESSDYKVLHIATHGILDDHDPMNTRLVFYQGDDTIEDGNLYAYEIYNMQLNADLAVLSACNTGSGKLQEGEGIMNLARGFSYAGVPGIVMSLWSVNDLSSAKIMEDFYYNLKEGYSKSIALQKAKINYLEDSDNLTANPYYWAGFVIIGNQHEISFKSNLTCGIVIVSGLLALIVILLVRRRIKRKS